MSVFENSMKTYNVVENDPYDWERSTSDGTLTINTTATTPQHHTRLTPAHMGYDLIRTPVPNSLGVSSCSAKLTRRLLDMLRFAFLNKSHHNTLGIVFKTENKI